MKKTMQILSHAVTVLSLMFLVFLVLDQFNPMMNFVNNSISMVLLGCLSVLGIVQSILLWKQE